MNSKFLLRAVLVLLPSDDVPLICGDLLPVSFLLICERKQLMVKCFHRDRMICMMKGLMKLFK